MTASASNSSYHPATTVRVAGTAAVRGIVTGVAASMVMAAYAMIAAATYQHTGFFTPLYHIASTFIAPDAMMTSMMKAAAGHTFYFTLGPAVVGAVVHMMIGAMYGLAFAVLAQLAKLHGLALIGAGMVWGLVVFAVSTWIGLPLAASLFGGGDPVSHMASKVGYPTFLVEHLLFGGALAMMLAAWRPARR